MQFVGKDFLSMPAPPGYKAGVGRGAVGFSTTAERGGGDNGFPGRRPDRTPSASQSPSAERVADANGARRPAPELKRENSEAEAIYAAIESRLAAGRRKKRPTAMAETTASPNPPPLKAGLEEVSIDEWASLPDASDLTHRNKRLREDERALRRNYAVPDSMILAQQNEEQRLAEVRRKRLMLENMIKAEPHNPEGFLGLARLEQEAARHKKARLVIEKGTLMCPQSPEVWLESIDLHPHSSEARAIAAKACRACPDSEQLWLRAVALEPTNAMKAQVAHEALLKCSQSVQLWLLSAQFEADDSAKREILQTAVDFLPDKEELWLALIDTYAGSHEQPDLLRKAHTHCPASIHLWLLAARKSADADLKHMADEVVSGKALPRSELVQTLFSLGPDDERIIRALTDSLKLEISDLNGQSIESETRDIIYSALPKSELLYVEWAKADPKILETAVVEFPHSQVLWREYIAAGGDVNKALEKNEDALDEALLQTAVQSLLLRGHVDTALDVLSSRSSNSSMLLGELLKIYEYGNRLEDALSVANKGITQWPECPEFYLAKGRLEPENAVGTFKDGLKKVPLSNKSRSILWQELALRGGSAISRRAILSQAIREHPNDGALWLQRVLLEKHEGLPVTLVLEDALRACPTYGLLWWEVIKSVPPSQRKAKLVEAVKGSKGDVYVLIAGGLIFLSLGQQDKAKDWFIKARGRDPSNGDVLLWMSKYGLADAALLNEAVSGSIHNGQKWSKAYQKCVIQQRSVENALHEAASELENPF